MSEPVRIARPNSNVEVVQWLRGVAAMMVVVHHARNSAPWLFNPLEHYAAFAWGVDIFFVISGFIMFIAARGEAPIDFIKRRALRVIPLYWLATLCLLLISYRQHAFQLSMAEIEHLVKSLLFLPHYSLSDPSQIWPFLIPGWTLNYEMFFYVVFFLSLLVKRPLTIVTLTMVALVGFGLSQPTSTDPLLRTYTSPLMLEFCAGIWIGKLYTSRQLHWMVSLLLPVGAIGLFVLPFVGNVFLETPLRLLYSTMIMTGTLAVARFVPHVALLRNLGDASYSIYLSHTIIGLSLSHWLIHRLPIEGWVQFTIWICVSLVVCGTLGYLIHILIEKPLLKFLRNKLISRGRLTSSST